MVGSVVSVGTWIFSAAGSCVASSGTVGGTGSGSGTDRGVESGGAASGSLEGAGVSSKNISCGAPGAMFSSIARGGSGTTGGGVTSDSPGNSGEISPGSSGVPDKAGGGGAASTASSIVETTSSGVNSSGRLASIISSGAGNSSRGGVDSVSSGARLSPIFSTSSSRPDSSGTYSSIFTSAERYSSCVEADSSLSGLGSSPTLSSLPMRSFNERITASRLTGPAPGDAGAKSSRMLDSFSRRGWGSVAPRVAPSGWRETAGGDSGLAVSAAPSTRSLRIRSWSDFSTSSSVCFSEGLCLYFGSGVSMAQASTKSPAEMLYVCST